MESNSESQNALEKNAPKTTGAFARAAFVSALVFLFTMIVICVLVFADDQTVGIYEWLSVVGSFAVAVGTLSALITAILILAALMDYFWKFRIRKFSRIAGSILFIFVAALIMPALGKLRPTTIRHLCETEMKVLGKRLGEYETTHGRLPDKNNWCEQIDRFYFRHPIVGSTEFYALNERLCGKSLKGVSPDIVLAFDSNLPGPCPIGSSSALSAKAHNGFGSNILFADLTVKFVRKKDFVKLKW